LFWLCRSFSFPVLPGTWCPSLHTQEEREKIAEPEQCFVYGGAAHIKAIEIDGVNGGAAGILWTDLPLNVPALLGHGCLR
jgi:hypothetical protein